MNIELIKNSKVAVIRNVISEEACKNLHDFVVDAKVNNLDIGTASIEDKMLESQDTIEYWKMKNIFLSLCPEEYRSIGHELHHKQNALLNQYLKLIGINDAKYNPKFLEPIVVHLYKQGDNLDPHLDNHDYALVFYLSSPEEFTGGDLVYPNLDLRITPSRGMLVISPSKELHEVEEITSGYRCAITSFIGLDKSITSHQ